MQVRHWFEKLYVGRFQREKVRVSHDRALIPIYTEEYFKHMVIDISLKINRSLIKYKLIVIN